MSKLSNASSTKNHLAELIDLAKQVNLAKDKDYEFGSYFCVVLYIEAMGI